MLPKIDISPWKEQLTELYLTGSTIDHLIAFLQEQGTSIQRRALQNRLKEWNVRVLQHTTRDEYERKELYALISIFFFVHGYSNEVILHAV